MASAFQRLTFFEPEISMNKIVLAASLLLISATAHAGTYSVDGVTVHIKDGCLSSRCVSINAPGYGYYDGATNRGGRYARLRKLHKDSSRIASTAKPVPAPAVPAVVTAPAKQADPAPQALPSDSTPAK
jgi:hypothetical protein